MVWLPDVRWDERNEEHIARHGLEPWQVEEAIEDALRMVRIGPARFRLLGSTRGGRFLTVFLDRDPDQRAYYVVTARDATPSERRTARRR